MKVAVALRAKRVLGHGRHLVEPPNATRVQGNDEWNCRRTTPIHGRHADQSRTIDRPIGELPGHRHRGATSSWRSCSRPIPCPGTSGSNRELSYLNIRSRIRRRKAVARSSRAGQHHDAPRLFRSRRYLDSRRNRFGKPQKIIFFPHARWERCSEFSNKFRSALVCSVLIHVIKHGLPFWRSPLQLDVAHRVTLPLAPALRHHGGE